MSAADIVYQRWIERCNHYLEPVVQRERQETIPEGELSMFIFRIPLLLHNRMTVKANQNRESLTAVFRRAVRSWYDYWYIPKHCFERQKALKRDKTVPKLVIQVSFDHEAKKRLKRAASKKGVTLTDFLCALLWRELCEAERADVLIAQELVRLERSSA